MANKDLKSNVDVVQANPPKAYTSTATSAAIDLQGYDSAFVEVNFGAITDGTLTPSLTHSADGTTYTDAGTDGALNGAFTAGLSGTGTNAVQRVGYTGGNRYLKVLLTNSGSTTTGGLASSSVVRGHPALGALA